MIPPPPVDHLSAALGKLIQQYQGKAGWLGFLTAATTNAQELETVLASVITDRYLSNATAGQLDVLGKIVGVARDGFSDADYSTLIQCQIRVNLSSGTAEDLISVVAPLLQAGESVRVVGSQPASFILYLNAATTLRQATLIGGLVKQARAAGVYGQVIFSEVPPAQTFTLDIGPGLDQGHLAGSIVS